MVDILTLKPTPLFFLELDFTFILVYELCSRLTLAHISIGVLCKPRLPLYFCCTWKRFATCTKQGDQSNVLFRSPVARLEVECITRWTSRRGFIIMLLTFILEQHLKSLNDLRICYGQKYIIKSWVLLKSQI